MQNKLSFSVKILVVRGEKIHISTQKCCIPVKTYPIVAQIPPKLFILCQNVA